MASEQIRPEAGVSAIRIDFVSDITCPWCAIGVSALERALERAGDDVAVDLHFRPFELNPDMPAQGEDLERYLMSRVGMSAEQVAASHAMLRERGATVGFEFGKRSKVWNTFDAHRLLKWADVEGPPGGQRKLKLALMRAYHGEGRNPSARDVLLDVAGQAGLDVERARAVLDGSEYAAEVRADQVQWRQAGVASVPTLVIDEKYGVSGARSVDEYERILRQVKQTNG
jgi:predicted DsbA family dithiol-disulfide isomerase